MGDVRQADIENYQNQHQQNFHDYTILCDLVF